MVPTISRNKFLLTKTSIFISFVCLSLTSCSSLPFVSKDAPAKAQSVTWFGFQDDVLVNSDSGTTSAMYGGGILGSLGAMVAEKAMAASTATQRDLIAESSYDLPVSEIAAMKVAAAVPAGHFIEATDLKKITVPPRTDFTLKKTAFGLLPHPTPEKMPKSKWCGMVYVRKWTATMTMANFQNSLDLVVFVISTENDNIIYHHSSPVGGILIPGSDRNAFTGEKIGVWRSSLEKLIQAAAGKMFKGNK